MRSVFPDKYSVQYIADLSEILNKEGREGWMLVQILTPEMAQGVWTGKTGNLLAILQREISSS